MDYLDFSNEDEVAREDIVEAWNEFRSKHGYDPAGLRLSQQGFESLKGGSSSVSRASEGSATEMSGLRVEIVDE